MNSQAVERLTRALHAATRKWVEQESGHSHRCYVTPEQNGVVLEYNDPGSIEQASGTIEVITIAVTRGTVRVRDSIHAGMAMSPGAGPRLDVQTDEDTRR